MIITEHNLLEGKTIISFPKDCVGATKLEIDKPYVSYKFYADMQNRTLNMDCSEVVQVKITWMFFGEYYGD